MNENVIVPQYNGIIRRLNPQCYMLDVSWQITKTAGADVRLCGIAGYPFASDVQHSPLNCRYESITDVVWYHLRMFFYYKTPHDLKEFPVKLGFRSEVPDTDVTNPEEGKVYTKPLYQTAALNFLVQS